MIKTIIKKFLCKI